MLAGNKSSSLVSFGVSPCSSEYCAMVSSTWRFAATPWVMSGSANALPRLRRQDAGLEIILGVLDALAVGERRGLLERLEDVGHRPGMPLGKLRA